MRKLTTLTVLVMGFQLLYAQPSGYVAGEQSSWTFNGRHHGYFHPAGTVDYMYTLISFTGNGETSSSNYQVNYPQKMFEDLGINHNGKWTLSDGKVYGIRLFTIHRTGGGYYNLDYYSDDITYFIENTAGLDLNKPHRIWYAGLSGGVDRMWGVLANDPNFQTNNPYRTIFGGTISLSNCYIGVDVTSVSAGKRHWVWAGENDGVCASSNGQMLYNDLSGTKNLTIQTGGQHDNGVWGVCWGNTGTTASTNRWLWIFNEKEGEQLIVSLKTNLQGAYNSETGLMNDNLRSAGLIPLAEPYTGMTHFSHSGGGGGETVPSSAFSGTGTASNDIVDWVFVQLHNGTTGNVIATKSALIQRDGDIVTIDPTGEVHNYVGFAGQSNGNYYVSIRHRNHLGVRTTNPLSLSTTSLTTFDFTTSLLQAYAGSVANNPMATISSGIFAMWGGNLNGGDGYTRRVGSAITNDYTALLAYLGQSISIANVYTPQDLNMDGTVKKYDPENPESISDYSILMDILSSAVVLTQAF